MKSELQVRGSRTEPWTLPHLNEKMSPRRGEAVEGTGILTLSKRLIKIRLVPIRGLSSVQLP